LKDFARTDLGAGIEKMSRNNSKLIYRDEGEESREILDKETQKL